MSALNRDPTTVTRWILRQQQKYPDAKGDLSILLNSITLACKMISNAAKAAGIYQLYGLAGSENKSGDAVKKLDVFSNDCMINCISWTGSVAVLGSEETEDPILVKTCENAKYVVVFDPLDGSSNIDANVSVGTIFGIFKVPDEIKEENITDSLLQKGRDLVCAGYCMYGDSTLFVISFGDSVQGFTLDPTIGEFLLTHKDIKIPQRGKIYSINEGNSMFWDDAVTGYIKHCKNPKKGKPKKARYIGSMVADVHRTLLYGGIFLYPGTKTDRRGKLRLLYEAQPMSFIVEAAGGKSTNGRMRIQDCEPDDLHCRTSIMLGSSEDVDDLIAYYKEFDDKNEKKDNK